MEYHRRFKFLICAPGFDDNELEGMRLHEIGESVQKLGFQVVRAKRPDDAELAIRTDAAIGCIVVDWGKGGVLGKAAARDAAPGRGERRLG